MVTDIVVDNNGAENLSYFQLNNVRVCAIELHERNFEN